MRKYLSIIAVAALLLGSCGLPFLQAPAVGPADEAGLNTVKVVPTKAGDLELFNNDEVNYGYIIVKTNDGFDQARFEALGAKVVGSFTLDHASGTYWRLHKSEGYAQLISKLRYQKGVQYAEPELVSKRVLPIVQEDASKGLLSGDLAADPRAQASEYSLAITHALDAYKTVGYGTNTVYVGVIDTGINMAHEDFWYDHDTDPATPDVSIVEYAKSAFVKAADGTMTFVGDGVEHVTVPIGANWDDQAHGTHVSGTIAARGDNRVGVAGVAWKQVKLISYKCFADADSGSGSDWAVYYGLADMADWKVAQDITQATIPVNMSLGGSLAGSFELEMINYGLAHGILPIVAMGNDGRRISQFPAAYAGVIAVGATNGKDEKVHFSNTGAWISVSAPGYDIISTGNGSSYWNGDPWGNVVRQTEYQWMSGTSMATPFVTGVVGYLLSFDNTLTPYQIKRVLELTADDVNGGGFDEDLGYGRVNVLAAATMVSTGTGLPAAGVGYVTKKITVTVENTSGNYHSGMTGFDKRVANQPVYLYSTSGDVIAVAHTNGTNGEAVFYGLPADTYEVRTNFFGDMDFAPVTIDDTADATVSFSFNKNIVFICTVPNEAYNAGADGTDTVITVYSDEALTTVAAGPYDSDTLDTLQAELAAGTYWVKISSYEDDYSLTAANYGLQVGFSAIDGINLADVPARLATDDDSHEADNDGAEATAKGAITLDTPIAANLLDEDVFQFIILP